MFNHSTESKLFSVLELHSQQLVTTGEESKANLSGRLVSLLCILLYLFTLHRMGVPSALAESEKFRAPIKQSLDRANSKVNFRLNTEIAPIEGNFTSFDGSLTFSGPSLTQSKLRLQIDPRVFSIDKEGSLIDLSGLLSKLPPQTATFESSSITATSQPGNFVIEGELRKKDFVKIVRIPAKLLKTTRDRSELAISVERVIEDWPRDIPLPVVPGKSTGAVNARLVFADVL